MILGTLINTYFIKIRRMAFYEKSKFIECVEIFISFLNIGSVSKMQFPF